MSSVGDRLSDADNDDDDDDDDEVICSAVASESISCHTTLPLLLLVLETEDVAVEVGAVSDVHCTRPPFVVGVIACSKSATGE